MTLLAYKFDIVVNQGVCVVGHGKNLVDAIYGLSKNTIYQVSHQPIKEAVDASNNGDRSPSVHTFEEENGCILYLPAEDSKIILEKN